MRKIKLQYKGFTVLELTIALMVSSIILTAVVTLAHALSSAYESTYDINEKQAKFVMLQCESQMK